MNIVTRIAPITRRTAEPAIKAAREVAARLGVLRADLWNQYGGLRAWGGKATELAKTFKATAPPERYGVDFKGWERTTLQVLDDILMTHAAIRAAVEPKIEARYGIRIAPSNCAVSWIWNDAGWHESGMADKILAVRGP